MWHRRHTQPQCIANKLKEHRNIVKIKWKKSGITLLPSCVSNPSRRSSQSASRGRPSSHNSPFTWLTRAPFTLQAKIQQPWCITSVRTNKRIQFCKVHLPDTLSHKERCGDASGSLHGPAIGQLDAEPSLWSFNSPLVASFIPEGLEDLHSLR